jgi:BirA family biotin operon repressor/biotin-[acetyl-CoA-carboxylase] ligase
MVPVDGGGMPAWLRRVAVCASTNDRLRDELESFGHGDCLWTENQTAGRGQHGRRWLSPPGVLTASFLLRLPPDDGAGLASLAAGLAVARAIESLAPGLRILLKWPNDCYCHDRKLAGVLCEARQRGPDRWCIAGIGLNLAPRWRGDAAEAEILADLPMPPIGLAEASGATPTPIAMLQALHRELLAGWTDLAGPGTAGLLAAIRERDWLRGRKVAVIEPDAGSGVADGITRDGHLRLRRDDGTITVIANGRVRPLAGDG